MPGNTCCICKTTGTKLNLKMFLVPKHPGRRKLWHEACGKILKDSARVCERHFQQQDFHKPKIESNLPANLQRRRLKTNAVPTQLLPDQAEERNEYIMPLYDPVSIQQPLLEIESEEEQILMENQITTEDIDYLKSDESAVQSLNTISTVDDEANENYEDIIFEENSMANILQPQEDCYESMKYTCGSIKLIQSKKRYLMSCSFCSMEFEISHWQQFVEHMETSHNGQQEQEDQSLTGVEHTWESGHGASDESNMGADEKTLDTELSSPSNQHANNTEDQAEETQADINEIRFGKTKDEIVMDFLRTIETRPILWGKRNNSPEAFDIAIDEVASNMLVKWQFHMTPQEVRNSLQRCKDYHRRFLLFLKKGLQIKFRKYAEIIDGFLLKPKFNCDLCANIFNNEIQLKTHLYTRHNVGKLPYKCKHCDEHFAARDKLTRHENQKHAKEIKFFCTICQRGFVYEYMLRRHRVVHQDARRTCDICGKKFRHPTDVRMHKIHHESPKFECQVCGKKYYSQGKLKYHMKLHRNERDFVCDQCGKHFLRQRTLNEHTRVEHCGFMYNCGLCERKFKTKSSVLKHKASTHLVREGTIEELERQSYKPYSKHMFIIDHMTNMKRLVCDICGSSYKYHAGLRAHKINAHCCQKKPQKKKSLSDINIQEVKPREAKEIRKDVNEILKGTAEGIGNMDDLLKEGHNTIEEYIEYEENDELRPCEQESVEMEILEETLEVVTGETLEVVTEETVMEETIIEGTIIEETII